MNPHILAFGDSLTAGYGLAQSDSFAAQLEGLLKSTFPEVRVDNHGVSGDTTKSALARLPGVLSRLRTKPDLVIVELGANDLIRGIPIAVTRANLGMILDELGRCGLPVLLAQMDAPAFLGDFGRSCTSIYGELAMKHRIAVAPFFPAGVLGHPSLTLRDHIHPNAEGTKRIACAFVGAVEKALRANENRAA